MMIFCFRDKVINTQPVAHPDVDEDVTPRGKKYKKRGGIVSKVIFAVDLYFVVPNRAGWYAQMLRIREHFKEEIVGWNEGYLEYIEEPLSACRADESYYQEFISGHQNSRAFAYEISDMDDYVKTFKYHGFYCMGAWRGTGFRPLHRPQLPYDWDTHRLNELVAALMRR
jgi:hypothetical protein